MVRISKALGALIALAVLAAGVPWALVHYIGNPWPDEGISLAAPITDGAIIGLVAALVWVLWAQLMVCILAEAGAAFRGREATRVPGTMGFQQHLARRLVGALLLAGVATPIIAGTATAAENITTPLPQTVTSTVVQADTPDDQDDHAQAKGAQHQAQQIALEPEEDDGPGRTKTVVVQPLDSLWSIAEAELGEGDRWTEIAGLNDGRVMNDGTTFSDPHQLHAGWELLVPDATAGQTGSGGERVTVEAGDTLSEIAQEELGDASAYPQLFEANQGQSQPGGGTLTDPDLIQPGWTITIPGAADQPDVDVPEPTKPPAAAEEPVEAEQQPMNPGMQPVAGAAAAGAELGGTTAVDPQPQETVEPQAPAAATQSPIPAPAVDVDQEPPAEQPQETAGEQPSAEAAPGTTPLTGAPAPVIEFPDVAPQTPPASTGAAPEPGAAAPQTPIPSPQLVAVDQEPEQPQAPEPDEPIGDEPAAETEEEASESWPTRTKGGVLALTAGALIGLIALRRQQQMRRRTPGAALPLPDSDEAEEVETELRTIADPVEVAHVDAALRSIAAVADSIGATRPTLRLARLTEEQLEVYFAAPARLDTPWRPTGDPTVWEMSTATLPMISAPAGLDAPYPALVTVGDDEDGGTILVNLTDVGTFGVGGELAAEALRGYVAELGASPWASGLSIYITGELGGIAGALGTGRVHVIRGEEIREQAYGPAGSSVLIDVAGVVDAEIHDWLRAAGVAVVTNGWAAGETGVSISSDQVAQLAPWHVSVTPQLVDDRTWAGLLEILRASQSEPITPAEAERGFSISEEPEDVITWNPEPTPHQGPVLGPQKTAAVNAEEEAESTVTDESYAAADEDLTPETLDEEDLAEPEPETAEAPQDIREQLAAPAALRVISDEQHQVLPEVEEEATAAPGPTGLDLLDTGHPVIRLLTSQVTITGTAAEGPANASHRKACTRLAAYMALNPAAPRYKLVNAVWGGQGVSDNTVDSRLSHLRKWLGEAPHGEKYFPPRGTSLSELVTSDWDVFTRLVGSNPLAASTADLAAALTLVADEPPMDGEDSKHYGWAEHDVAHMTTRIIDTCHELARRHYFAGEYAAAELAAAKGVTVDPGHEALWRLRIHIAMAGGTPSDVAQAISRMTSRLNELGFSIDEETEELLEAIQGNDTETLAQHREAL